MAVIEDPLKVEVEGEKARSRTPSKKKVGNIYGSKRVAPHI
jgi:hypothetical protein